MKPLILILIFMAASAGAQALPAPTPLPLLDLTNIEEFSSRSGTLIEREFTRVGDFTGVRVDVVKVTDLMAKTFAQGIRISANVGREAPRDAVFIDADEIDTFLKAMALMKSSAFSTTPDNFTDVAYRSRGGLAIGALYANKRWNPYLRLDRFDPKTSINIEQNDIETLRDLVTQAKERMK